MFPYRTVVLGTTVWSRDSISADVRRVTVTDILTTVIPIQATVW